MNIENTVILENKTINKAQLCLLASFSLAPLIGSTVLIFVAGLMFYISKDTISRKSSYFLNSPFKFTGIALIFYFCCFAVLEIFHTENIITWADSLGKIFPIFVVGVMSFLFDNKKLTVTHKNIGDSAIIGVYVTILFALVFKFVFPVVTINGYDFVTNSLDVHGRLTMLSGNALPFGTLFITLSFLTLVGFTEKSILKRIITLSAFIIGILTVAMWNQSRGPLLSAAPLLLISLWYVMSNLRLSKKQFLFMIALLLIGILFGFYIFNSSMINGRLAMDYGNQPQYGTVGHFLLSSPQFHPENLNTLYEKYWYAFHTFLEMKPYDISIYLRLMMYQGSMNAIVDSPIIGHGLDGKFSAVKVYLPAEWSNVNYGHLHNVFLNHLLAGGIIGLINLMVFVLSPLIALFYCRGQKCKSTTFFTLIIIVAMIFNGMSNVLIMHDLIAVFFAILIFTNVLTASNKNTQN